MSFLDNIKAEPGRQNPGRKEKEMKFTVYHGAGEKIEGRLEERGGDGIYFSSSKKVANSYDFGGGIYEYEIELNNPMVIDCKGRTWKDLPLTDEIDNWLQGVDFTSWKAAKWAKRHGYDGVILKNVYDAGGGQHIDYEDGFADTYIAFPETKFEMVS